MTDKYKIIITNSEFLIFLFSFAVILGPAMTIMDSFDYTNLSPDIKTYLGIANGDFDQSAVRRYRIIVPFFASIINFCFGFVFNKIQPWSFQGPDFSLGLSFLMVNTSLLSIAAIYIYKILKHYNVSIVASIISVISFLSCRWTAYIGGLPWVDSLYFLMVVLLVYAIISSNRMILFITLLIGPLSKESFIFFYPIVLIYANESWMKKIGFIAIGILFAFIIRVIIDYNFNFIMSESISEDINHFNQITDSLKRMFSFHGLYELLSITGIYSILFIALLSKKLRAVVKFNLPKFTLLFFVIIIFHAMLSSDLTRMYYLLMPILCLMIGVIIDNIYTITNQ